MAASNHDRDVLRDLAKRYVALCESDRNKALIDDWRRLNNMQPCRPMIAANTNLLGDEIGPQLPECRITDERLRNIERRLQRALWDATLGDDRVFYPWFGVRAEMFRHPEGVWGVTPNRVRDEVSRGWRNMPVLTRMEDLGNLKATEHRVLNARPPIAERVEEVFGDILPVEVDRSTIYPVWGGTDLSEAPGALFGLEELLMALYTAPDMVHAFMAFTRDAVVANLEQGEAAGDWSTTNSNYYMTPACCEALPDPQPGTHGAKLKDLAYFTHAQEFEAVSPEMHQAFLLDYQLPILELFGRVAYGCCETLDMKLGILEQIPNMTKILSGPRSDPSAYPERVGDRCVISWRPVASIVAAEAFDEQAQRRQIREGLEKLKGCNIEVHMHEPMTVHGDLNRVKTWVRIVREEAESVWAS